MSIEAGLAIFFSAAGILLLFLWLNVSDIGNDILKAVHLVIRRRLRIWARGNGVNLWEDEA